MSTEPTDSLVGARAELEIGPVAHGGHCVARWDGRVVFVRHTLPGERVVVRITEGTVASRFLRGDAVEVLRPAAGRVPAPCPYAVPGACGGCDFQHVDVDVQRDLLAGVVREQLSRLAGIERDVVVEPVDAGDGLGWRTRVAFAVDPEGRLGLRRHRSHDVVPVDRCLIAHPDLPQVTDRRWAAASVEVAVAGSGDTAVLVDGQRVAGRSRLREVVHGQELRVSAGGFWQVHPRAAETLVDAVLEYAAVRTGDAVCDLYSGAGLFAVFLADQVGTAGRVTAVESHPTAVADARRNLHHLPQVEIRQGSVRTVLRTLPAPYDLVVLDPPRAGARHEVIVGVAGLRPRRVVYVACDPAALARDVATLAQHDYQLTELRAFALFPMTHHVECAALLERSPNGVAQPGASHVS